MQNFEEPWNPKEMAHHVTTKAAKITQDVQEGKVVVAKGSSLASDERLLRIVANEGKPAECVMLLPASERIHGSHRPPFAFTPPKAVEAEGL